MKYKFKLPTLQRLSRALASFAAVFTMVMSPVAQGAEAGKITAQQLQQGLEQAGLNKQMTFGEFYKKNKDLFPPRIQKEMEPFVAKFKNQMMPTFEVVKSKASDGTEVPVLRATAGNELINVQMYGQSDRYAKFQNTTLSEVDIINFNDMFVRIAAGDEKYGKQLYAPDEPNQSQAPPFEGYPAVTMASWHAMTQKERAAYIVNMRLLWNDARQVLIEADKRSTKGRKTSSNDATIEKWDHFFSMLSADAEAAASGASQPARAAAVPGAAATPPARAAGAPSGGGNKARPGVSSTAARNTKPTLKPGSGSSAYVSGENCIVAGYVSKYSASKCGVENIYDNYRDKDTGGIDNLVESANQACVSSKGAGWIACNPYVYGAPGGAPACADTNDYKSFQVATHYDGPCDSQSRLGSKVDFLKEDLQNGERYDEKNRLLKDAELEAKFKEEQAKKPEYVENFISGLLAFQKKEKIDFKIPLTEDKLKLILPIRDAFNKDIKNAKASCELAAKNKKNEKNFWGACDQLHRRFLDVSGFLQNTPGCLDTTGKKSETIKINDNLKCACPGGTEALPGTACGSQQPPDMCPGGKPNPAVQACIPGPPGLVSGDQTKAPGKCKKSDFPGAEAQLNDNCECQGGGEPKLIAGDAKEDGPKHYTCVGAGPVKQERKPEECGFLCGLLKFTKSVLLPVVAVVASIYVLRQIFTPKNPSIKSPGDICRDGTTGGTCAQTCTPPQVWKAASSKCGCPDCVLGQSPNASCVCTSSGTTTTLTCPDGVTKVTCAEGVTSATCLATCPAASYNCWDGSVVPSPLNCPEKPSSTNSKPGKASK